MNMEQVLNVEEAALMQSPQPKLRISRRDWHSSMLPTAKRRVTHESGSRV
jgi:hypothetical protein